MNTTPVRTGGLSWIFVTKLEALPMGKLGMLCCWEEEKVTENTSQNAQPHKYTELALKFLERNVPAGFCAEHFVCAESIPVFFPGVLHSTPKLFIFNELAEIWERGCARRRKWNNFCAEKHLASSRGFL